MSDPTKCNCPGVMRAGCPCDKCHGAGWYPESSTDDGDYLERYCDCYAGAKLRKRDGVK